MIKLFESLRMPRKRKRAFVPPKFTPKPLEVITLSDSSSSESEGSCDNTVEIIEKPRTAINDVEIIEKPETVIDDIQIIENPHTVIDILESSSSEEDDDCCIKIYKLSDKIVSKRCNSNSCYNSEALDYIPIPVSSNIPPRRKGRKKKILVENGDEIITSGKPRKKITTRLIQLGYPNTVTLEISEKSGLRPIIIDGANVGYGTNSGVFEASRIIVVVKYFLSRGHTEVVCFLPAHYRHKTRDPKEAKIMATYEKDQIVCYTPSRQLNGKSITPYDDRFIVQYASERDGVIITNDGYRDLLGEDSTWNTTIETRIVNYTFARGMFMLPKDPLGANGPTLDEMLRYPG